MRVSARWSGMCLSIAVRITGCLGCRGRLARWISIRASRMTVRVIPARKEDGMLTEKNNRYHSLTYTHLATRLPPRHSPLNRRTLPRTLRPLHPRPPQRVHLYPFSLYRILIPTRSPRYSYPSHGRNVPHPTSCGRPRSNSENGGS